MTGTIADTVAAADAFQGAGAHPEPTPPEPPERSPEARAFRRLPLAVAGAQILLEQWRRVLAHEAGTRSGADDENLHKMRVATRRFRAAAGLFGAAIDRAAGAAVVEPLVADVTVVASALGRVRDVDVFIAYLQSQAENAPYGDLTAIQRLIEVRQTERAAARESMLAVLDGPEMQRLRERVEPLLRPLAAPPAPGPIKRTPKRLRVGRRAPRLVAKQVRRLRRRAEGTVVPLPAELHRVRIAAKKLRYAAEFLQPGYPSLLPPIADVATGIQDALGEAHDLDAVTQTLLSDLERTGETGDRALDGPAVAHLLRHNAERRDEALIRFRALWSSVPTPGSVRKQLLAAT